MNESLTPQELLYMYLDGECSPEQVAILFEAMSTDSELKKEFDEAVAFQQTLEEDKSKSAIPFSVTNSIFQRIGATIIPSSEIASTATVATTQTVSTSLFQSVWTFITNNSIVFGVSALLTLITGVEPSKKTIESTQKVSKQTITQTTQTQTDSKENSTSIQNNSVDSKESIPSNSQTTSNDISTGKQKKVNSTTTFPVNDKEESITDREQTTLFDEKDTQEYTPSVQIFPSLRMTYKEDDRPIFESLQQLPVKNSSRMFQMLTNEPLVLSIQLRSMNSLLNFPSRSVVESFSQNFGTTVLIDISKNHSFGIEISQETFPHFALETQRIQNFTTAPLFAAKETIMWTGASYQYSLDPIESIGDSKPFLRTTVGASAIGGVSKAIAGLQIPLTSSVFSTIGFEGSLFLINNASSINTSQKISVTYSLGWNFR